MVSVCLYVRTYLLFVCLRTVARSRQYVPYCPHCTFSVCLDRNPVPMQHQSLLKRSTTYSTYIRYSYHPITKKTKSQKNVTKVWQNLYTTTDPCCQYVQTSAHNRDLSFSLSYQPITKKCDKITKKCDKSAGRKGCIKSKLDVNVWSCLW